MTDGASALERDEIQKLRDQQRAISSVLRAVAEAVEAVSVGDLDLKGFARPVAAFEVRAP